MSSARRLTGKKRAAVDSDEWQKPKRPRTGYVLSKLMHEMPTPEATISAFVSEHLVQRDMTKQDSELVMLALLSLADLQEMDNAEVSRNQVASTQEEHASATHLDGSAIGEAGNSTPCSTNDSFSDLSGGKGPRKLEDVAEKHLQRENPIGSSDNKMVTKKKISGMCKFLDRITELRVFQKLSSLCLR